MALVKIQSSKTQSVNATELTLAWPSATNSNSRHLAFIYQRLNETDITTITPPSGWVSLARYENSQQTSVEVFTTDAGASRSGNEVFTWQDTVDAVGILAEYSASDVSVVNVGVSAFGSSLSGGSIVAQQGDTVLAAIASPNVDTQTNPSSGFSVVEYMGSENGAGGARIQAGLYGASEVAGGNYELTVQIANSRPYSGGSLVLHVPGKPKLYGNLTAHDGIPAPLEPRNALLQPYPSESFWNLGVATTATLKPLNMDPVGLDGNQFIFRWEEDIITGVGEGTLDMPEKEILEHNAGWSGANRCESRTGRVLTGNSTVSDVSIPVPVGFSTANYLGNTPNHASAHLRRRNGTIEILECQPTHFCGDGEAVSQYTNSNWVGDSIVTGGDGIKGGSHGGGYISALGGTIRLHEWRPGGEIPHATKIVLDTGKVCYNHDTQEECFTWPAMRADSGAVDGYGDSAKPEIPPEARMGMLLTLPIDFNTETLLTEPARILARSIKKYGTYLCDGDHGLDVAMFAVEWSENGRFIDQFQSDFGIKGFHRPGQDGPAPSMQQNFWADMNSIYTSFMIVTNNSASTPGGGTIGGSRRAPMAAPLAPIS